MPENTPNWNLPPERFMTQEEIGQTLLKAHELFDLGVARKRKPLVRDAMIIFTAMGSGLRRAEIASVMVADLHLGAGRSHLVVRCGKGGKSRIVHIGKDFKAVLKRYLVWKADNGELTPDAYLIQNSKRGRYTPTGLWKRWRKYAPNGHRLHDARHTTASQLLRAGQSLRMIAATLGHARLSTTALYAQVAPDMMRQGMESMESLNREALKRAARGSAVAVPA